MQTSNTRTAPQTPAQPVPAYEAPRVTDLGAWQALTLIYSVPINPAGILNPMGNNNGQ